MKIKLCGFTESASLEAAIKVGVDFAGFVFHESSPRNVEISTAQNLAKITPGNVAKVSVTVNASIQKLREIYNALSPQYFQLHGSESLEEISAIKKEFPQIKIIKAFAISNKEDLEQIPVYEDLVDHILLDNKNPGSGQSFDLDLVKNLETKNDWFLSGGINCDNVIDVITKTNAPMIDVSSGIEEVRGEKSIALINKLTAIIKK